MGWSVPTVAVVALLAAAQFVTNSWLQKKRTEAWRRVANELGLSFRSRTSDVLNQCEGMKLFARGYRQKITNAVSGDSGNHKITLADYQYQHRHRSDDFNDTHGYKRGRTRYHTVCVLQSESLDVPHFYLRPENALLDAIGSLLGGQDIDFNQDAAFSAAYVLQGDDEAAIRELFDADVRDYFARRASDGFQFEARGDTLAFRTQRRRDPSEAKQLMRGALEIANLLAKK